jgi:alkylation response protein AidB-like acyl-CoA dehydrogenase
MGYDGWTRRKVSTQQCLVYCAEVIATGSIGRGVKTIIEMVQSTRLDCTLGSASSARRALMLAINHAVDNV